MKKSKPLTESAQSVDSSHDTLNNARRNYKRQRELFLKAKTVLQECEYAFNHAKELCDQRLIETA